MKLSWLKKLLFTILVIIISSCKANHITAKKPIRTSSKVSSKSEKVLKEARKYYGVKHKIGGMDRKGIDCSGLTYQSFKSVGVKLPRSARDQVKIGQKVSLNKLQEGDLVFFSFRKKVRISHVGIVSKVKKDEIKFIHTSTSKGVREDDLLSNYWKKYFIIGKRVI